jgi:hypothetical protein
MKEPVENYFNRKRLYEKRQDIELEEVYEYGIDKSRRIIAELKDQGLYLPDKYIDRKVFKEDVKKFLSNGKKAMIIVGESGSGKTSSLIHLSEKILNESVMAYLVRCEGLPASAVNPDKLERTLTEELSYKGNFSEIIDWTEKKGKSVYFIFEALNEFTGPGKDPGKFFESINTILSRYRKKKGFKIMISSTDSTIPYILSPGNVLPKSMKEEKELYYQGEKGDIYRFRKFEEKELESIAGKYQVPFWAVEKVRKNKKIDLLNPRQFRIFAEIFLGKSREEIVELKDKEKYQKIVREMLKYSDYKMASKHIYHILKKDKILLKTLEEMARFMQKQKNLSPTWALYQEKNPKLAEMLRKNNWENLRKLKNLQLVKEERMSGREGIGDWKLSFYHDRVYEFLSKKAKKKLIVNIMNSFLVMFVFSIIFFLFGLTKFSKNITPSNNFIYKMINQNTTELGNISDESIEIYIELIKYESTQKKTITRYFFISGLVAIVLVLFYLSISLIFTILTRDFFENYFRRKDYRIKYLANTTLESYRKIIPKFTLIMMALVFGGLFLTDMTGITLSLHLAISITLSLLFISLGFFLIILFRNTHKFLKKRGSKAIFEFFTDKKELIYSIFVLFETSLVIGILFFSLWEFGGDIIPFKPIAPQIEYLNAAEPAYSELIEKKWISKDGIEKANVRIKEFEDKLISNELEKFLFENKFDRLFFHIWIFINIIFIIQIIKIFYLRKRLGPMFR